MTRIDEYAPWEALAKDEEFWAGFQKELETALTDRLLPVFMAGAYAGARLLPKRLQPEDLPAEKHLSGQHDQMTHAHGSFGSPAIGPISAREHANAQKWLTKQGLTEKDLEDNAEASFSAASADQRRRGMVWYEDGHDYASGLADRYGVSIDAACGTLAASSPHKRWERNKVCAEQALAEVRNPSVRVSGLTADNLAKTRRVARGENPETVLGGCKVRSFYHNLREPKASRETTIDTHMVNALGGKGLDRMSLKDHDAFVAAVLGRPALYSLFKGASDRVASRHGLRNSQAQAIIWTRQSELPEIRHR